MHIHRWHWAPSLCMSVIPLAVAWPLSSCSDTEDAESDSMADDDEANGDDDGEEDDDTGGSSFDTDGGVVEVVFEGNPLPCGDDTCYDAVIREDGVDGFMFAGCCAEETDRCGLDLAGIGTLIGLRNPGCEVLDAPGSEDPACEPSPPLEAALEELNGVSLLGCCQENGQCGYEAGVGGIGFGCVSPTRFGHDEGPACDFQP